MKGTFKISQDKCCRDDYSSEFFMRKDLGVVKKRIEEFYSLNDHWVGITTPDVVGAPANYCVWVELPQDQVFGSYWCKIKSIKFEENETVLRLKLLRQVTTINDSTDKCGCEHKTAETVSSSDNDLNISIESIKKSLMSNSAYFINNITTVHNIKETIIFISVLVVTAATGLFQVLQFLCDFLLKFMKETSNFIKAVSPILIACINLVGICISGLYMLIAYMSRDGKQPAPMHEMYYTNPSNRMLTCDVAHPNSHYLEALPTITTRRRGAVITELR